MDIVEKVAVITDGVPDSVQFAQEMGIRCNSVGWMRFDLDRDKQLLRDIRKRADALRICLRGAYVKTFSDVDAAWYILRPRIELGLDDTETKRYNGVWVRTIKAYRVPRGCDAFHFGFDWAAVSQRFADACKELGLSGLDFFWIPDTGKYDAQTFYYPAASALAPRVAGEVEAFRKQSYKRHTLEKITYDKTKLRELYRQADSLGGSLLYLEDILDEIQYADIPLMVDYGEMPDCDFAYLADWVHHCLLVRAEAARKLIREKVLDEGDLVPVLSFDDKLHRDLISQGVQKENNLIKVRDLLEEEHLQLTQKNRPRFIPSEKAALQTMRKSKKLKGKQYNKALKKEVLQKLAGTLYEAMTPYYKISDGGRVSDMVEYYAYQQAQEETKKFAENFVQDEAGSKEHARLTECVVIGATTDGRDIFLLEDSRSVIQFCREENFIVREWQQVHEFFYDNIEV